MFSIFYSRIFVFFYFKILNKDFPWRTLNRTPNKDKDSFKEVWKRELEDYDETAPKKIEKLDKEKILILGDRGFQYADTGSTIKLGKLYFEMRDGISGKREKIVEFGSEFGDRFSWPVHDVQNGKDIYFNIAHKFGGNHDMETIWKETYGMIYKASLEDFIKN